MNCPCFELPLRWKAAHGWHTVTGESPMRALIICLSIMFVSISAHGQRTDHDPGQAKNIFVSSADVTALAAKAKSERKEGQGMVFQPIFSLAPWDVNLEYRAAVASANVHEREAELFYVIDGSATMVVGGKLVNEKRTNPQNRTGTGVEGGTSRRVAKGDFILVPENTPHWFSAIDGTITLMSLHI